MKISEKLLTQIDSLDCTGLKSDGLISGKLGLIYFYYSMFKFSKKEEFLQKIGMNLELIFKNIEEQDSSILLDSSLGSGLSGFGYILSLLIEEGILANDYEDQIKNISDLAFKDAMFNIDKKNFDFIKGSFGQLHYLNFVKSTLHVELLVERFYRLFQEDSEFLFYNKAHYLEGIHIGYAHGLCAIVKIFNDIDCDKSEIIVKELLAKITKIIESKDCVINGKKFFLPRSIHETKFKTADYNFRAVLAWSNSDVNFSTLIYSLKSKYQSDVLLNLANEIALEGIHRKTEEHTRVWDHRFYFGSAGVLQMYNFMFQKTQKVEYLQASKFWYNETISFLKKDNISEHPLDFINNLPGTTLALLEFEESKSIGWSKLILQ